MSEKNIKDLTAEKQKFLEWAKEIKNKFDGPSSYFYLKTMDKIKENKENYENLLKDEKFFEYLYATLACWGMHRMDKNTRMANFKEFKESILTNKEKIIELSDKKLIKDNLESLKKKIIDIFNNLKIMSREKAPKFVANSKVMHFLLPDLIPPMDKGHIVYFFYGKLNSKGKKYIPTIKEEEKIFWEILIKFQNIAKTLNLKESDLINNWDTSIPKLIDNAIIGFNIYKFNQEKIKNE